MGIHLFLLSEAAGRYAQFYKQRLKVLGKFTSAPTGQTKAQWRGCATYCCCCHSTDRFRGRIYCRQAPMSPEPQGVRQRSAIEPAKKGAVQPHDSCLARVVLRMAPLKVDQTRRLASFTRGQHRRLADLFRASAPHFEHSLYLHRTLLQKTHTRCCVHSHPITTILADITSTYLSQKRHQQALTFTATPSLFFTQALYLVFVAYIHTSSATK